VPIAEGLFLAQNRGAEMEPNEQSGGGTGETSGSPRREQARAAAEKMIAQLQVMIDQAGKTAGPVLRDVAAKAAELTAVAAQNAGPVAHKAADVTEHAGQALAARSKDLAADLRKAAEEARAAQAAEKQGESDEGPSA
jgi:hypothetical protein